MEDIIWSICYLREEWQVIHHVLPMSQREQITVVDRG